MCDALVRLGGIDPHYDLSLDVVAADERTKDGPSSLDLGEDTSGS